MTHISLPYLTNSQHLFDNIRHLPWSIYLDSGQPQSPYGRYDIITAMPFITIVHEQGVTTVKRDQSSQSNDSDPLTTLQTILREFPASPHHLPIQTGAFGYFSYDLIYSLFPLPSKVSLATTLPAMAVGIYDWAIIVDHHDKQAWLSASHHHPSTKKIIEHISHLLNHPIVLPQTSFQLTSAWQTNLSKHQYQQAFDKIQRHIHQGDSYQANLSQCLKARCQGDSWRAYLQLREINPAPYAVYFALPQGQILSLSPESFLTVVNQTALSKPIKGTRPRGNTPQQDQALKNALLNNEKDRAENVMIVDLLRNDFAKICLPGSIVVPELLAIESHPAVHHLVSTIQGKLSPEKHSIDLLRACFPGGSITGVPKLRTLEIIESVEQQRRGIYCGAIGGIDFNGNMSLNIAIRTLVRQGSFLYCHGGSGIVSDSNCTDEYQECYAKINNMMICLNREVVSIDLGESDYV